MNKGLIIKLVGILVVSLIVVTVAIYFLYPYLNEEKYEQIAAENAAIALQGSTKDTLHDAEVDSLITGQDSVVINAKPVGDGNQVVDSLLAVNQALRQKIKEYEVKAEEKAESKPGAEKNNMPKEKFSDRIKSLLNLDEEKLSPIVNKLSDDQLVKLYNGSSSIQREKLLRSLSSDRAAKLMTQIMM